VEEVLADWREALAEYERLGNIEAVGHICAELSTYLFSIAHFEAAFETALRGLAVLENRTNPDRCLLLATAGFLLSNSQEAGFSAAHDLFAQALEMAEELNDERLLGPILGRKTFLHHAYWQGRKAADVGLEGAKLEQPRDPYFASYPLAFGGQCGMLWIGRLDEAARIGEEANALATRAGNEHARWFTGHYDSFREVAATGDLVRFEERRTALLEMELALQSGWIILSYVFLGRAQFWRGFWEKARTSLRRGAEMDIQGHTAGMSDSLLFLLAAYAQEKEVALAILEKRKEFLPRAGQPNMTGSWIMLEAAVEGLAMLDERPGAAALYPLTLEAIATGNLIRASYSGLVQTTAGIAAAAGGRWAQAEEHYRTALRQAHEIPYKIEQAEVRRWYARMLSERNQSGDQERARTLLQEAVTMYRQFGMPKHMERSEEMLKRLQHSPGSR
jgi:tetratricopeptide (TPR) repeat protein